LPDYPFLSPTFLEALEASGSASAATGWEARHLRLPAGTFMPLYVKTHSYGEYVFDWAWAEAYHRNGLAYYPKLVSAIPFTPVTGPRLQGPQAPGCGAALFERVRELAAATGASGWHLLFPDAGTRALFDGLGLLERSGVQFHWGNRGYRDFDDFLATFTARKRKMVRRERERVAAQGLRVEMVPGTALDAGLWDFFYRMYQSTYRKRSGTGGYLTRDFFVRIGAALREQIALAVAYDGSEPVAAALYLHDQERLYGRYWGSLRDYECLHFELCCYQGIEFAIRRGLRRFDAGAQGEHKIARGFEPVETWSLHWIRQPEFARAIADFLARERAHLQGYLAQARALLPYREPD
jgi:uncharacterized protein